MESLKPLVASSEELIEALTEFGSKLVKVGARFRRPAFTCLGFKQWAHFRQDVRWSTQVLRTDLVMSHDQIPFQSFKRSLAEASDLVMAGTVNCGRPVASLRRHNRT